MRLIPLLLLLLISTQSQAQKLKKLLWDNIKDCDHTIQTSMGEEDLPEDESIYDKLIEDTKNGYLHIIGYWPACGCGCDATVAAFKDHEEHYTLIKYEVWNCDNKFGIYASRKLEEVMPQGFGFTSFTQDGEIVEIGENSYFYLSAKIPQKGTDTKVSINLLPLGMVGKSKNGLSYNTKKVKTRKKAFYALQDIIEKIDSDAQLGSLLSGDYHNLPEDIIHQLDSKIGNNREYKNREDVQQSLLFLQEYYKAYSLLKHKEIILAWDKKSARFTIKSKGGFIKKMTFLQFLKSVPYYIPIC